MSPQVVAGQVLAPVGPMALDPGVAAVLVGLVVADQVEAL
jgi:hypothetical protein